MKENGNNVLGFVIMPNHVHFLVHYINTKQSLNSHFDTNDQPRIYGERKNNFVPFSTFRAYNAMRYRDYVGVFGFFIRTKNKIIIII